jgi:hypothetical protein
LKSFQDGKILQITKLAAFEVFLLDAFPETFESLTTVRTLAMATSVKNRCAVSLWFWSRFSAFPVVGCALVKTIQPLWEWDTVFKAVPAILSSNLGAVLSCSWDVWRFIIISSASLKLFDTVSRAIRKASKLIKPGFILTQITFLP